MKKNLLAILALAVTACVVEDRPVSRATHRFDNGLWFDGERFTARSAHIVDGTLVFRQGGVEAETVIDLEGGYVVPPLCEGHNHNLGDSAELEEVEETIRTYLQYGVYYVMIQGSFRLYRDRIADRINHAGSVDVAFANNGLTGSGGHPRALRQSLMERYGSYPEFTPETLPDAGYFEADDLPQLHEKWALILDERPDFVKAMLLHSEEYDRRKDDPEFYGRRGLNPELLPEVVRLAHAAGLRVSVHVETDADMATALRAGADIIAHLPSHDKDSRLSDATVALAAENGAALITTLSLASRLKSRNPELYEPTLGAQREDLSRLTEAGANLVLGSDNVRGVSHGEAEHLAALGVLDNRTILTMWTENCARTVFPDRKVGRLADGYEASFLVLDDDPLSDLDVVKNIRLRIKDGRVLNP